jgi:hypothetical protein
MMLSKTQENCQKFKYQPLKTQKDIKKLKKQIITIMSDYLDNLLQDFAIKEKELNKKLKKEVLSISITKN